MVKRLNLKEIDPQTTHKLYCFFADQREQGIVKWEKDKVYEFRDGTKFTLSHEVVQRARKTGKGSEYPDSVRYELISNEHALGEGGYGVVKKSAGNIAFRADGSSRFRGEESRQRVVKEQRHSEEHNPLEQFQAGEVDLSQKTPHLHLKNPTIEDSEHLQEKKSYTVMNRIQGKRLTTILNDDRLGIEVLTTTQRRELTIALLTALNDQAAAKGIMHGDIKPENIIVQLGPPIRANLIDYGFAEEISKQKRDTEVYGTGPYMAPERCFRNEITEEKADVFSMARVISLVWGANIEATARLYDFFDEKENTLAFIKNGDASKLLVACCENIGVEDREKNIINGILLQMLELDPEERITLDEAMQHFSRYFPLSQQDNRISAAEAPQEKVVSWVEPSYSGTDALLFRSQEDEPNKSIKEAFLNYRAQLKQLGNYGSQVDEARKYMAAYTDLSAKIQQINSSEKDEAQKKQEISALAETFLTKTTQEYTKGILLLPNKCLHACGLFIGTVLGGLIGAVAGLARIGVELLAASVAPVFGNLAEAALRGRSAFSTGALFGTEIGSMVAEGITKAFTPSPPKNATSFKETYKNLIETHVRENLKAEIKAPQEDLSNLGKGLTP